MPAESITARVPPACRRGVESAPAGHRDGDDVLLEFPEWRPRRPARHLLPALSVLSDEDFSFRFELQGRMAGEWSPWVAAASIGPHPFMPAASQVGGLAVDIDVYQATRPIERLKLRLRLHAEKPAAVLAAPWLVTLSACDLAPLLAGAGPGRARLAVPALTQLEAPADVAMRICSPTSVAMVLAYFGAPVQLEACAAEIFHPATDRYGVWPAAIRSAGKRGVLGYLLRFPDWASATWCLDHGLPVVASVNYEEGELTGAALDATTGHLLVLTGYEDGDVFVNDPVAPSRASVARHYRRDEVVRIWLERAGVGYVLFRL